MENNSVLTTFTKNYLESLRLRVSTCPFPLTSLYLYDHDLRKTLYGKEAENKAVDLLQTEDSEKPVFLLISDPLLCRYLVFPGSTKETGMIAGPYLISRPDVTELRQLCEIRHLSSSFIPYLRQYYSLLPVLHDEKPVEAYLNEYGASLYGNGRYEVRRMETKIQASLSALRQYREALHPELADEIAQRYAIEDKMTAAIMHGDEETARKCLEEGNFYHSFRRTSNTLRNRKNLMIVGNTLGRKAAQLGGVHPYHLDAMSADIAVRIENSSTMQELRAVSDVMIHSYCSLVCHESAGNHSPAVARAITWIRIHYREPISLQETADACTLNKNYLASVFKKETGETVTSYINRTRIDQAKYLFDLQAGSAAEAASLCGIPDLTYFGRLFHRYTGMTPTQYKKQAEKKHK